jgi:UPF0716 protein FxsA
VGFVVVPLAEIYAVIRVGQWIGAWWTVLLLIADSLVGAWLVKQEGRRTWRALVRKLERAGVPGRELADGALVLIGGTLLLTPGFITDVLGFALVLPVTRPLFRRALTAYATSRVTVMAAGGFPTAANGDGVPPAAEDVVRGEVIDED